MIQFVSNLLKPMQFFINIVRDMYYDHFVPNQGGGGAVQTGTNGEETHTPMPNTSEHPGVQQTLARLAEARAKMSEYGIKHISERENIGFRYAGGNVKSTMR